MSPEIVFPGVAIGGLLPALIVLGAAGLVLLLDLAPPRDTKTHLGGIALAGIVAALLVAVTRWGTEQRAFRDMVLLDNYALFFDLVICYAAALVVMLSMDYLGRTGGESGEYYSLVLFATAGMMLMVSAGDLIVVFLSLELMSLSLYVLSGLFKTRLASGEASLKYFLLGAFASSFLLYGIALIYGATGSTSLDRIAASPAAKNADPLVLAGLGLMLVGFGFKISAVPFHMWAPDVYQGAPTTITSFIATGSKAAAFAALIRVLVVALRGAQADWSALLWGIAAVTMTLGNVVALAQSNLKRMLAYSSIAHGGYMLMGLVAGGAPGAGAILFYLLAYTFTTVGAFGAIGLCARAGEEAVEVGDYAGMARRHPVLAATLALFLLSLVGIPPLAGFVAKFYLFGSAVRAGYLWLTVIAVLNSAIAAYYYLRVIVYMYMREPEGEGLSVAPSLAGGLAMTIALPHRGWLFDLDGTVYLGEALIPGADEVIAALRADGRPVAFLSNKPLSTRRDYADKLTRLGIPATAEQVVNSSLVLARHLQELDPGAPVFVIGEPPLIGELRDHGFEVRSDAEVRWVVIAFDRTFDYAKLNTALQAVRRRDARLIATNPDRTCPVEGGEIPDCAGMMAAVEAVTSKSVEVIVGKPSPIILRAALAVLGVTAADCVIVGDRLDTDIVMGKQLGLATVLVLSGVTRPGDPRIAELRPDLVLPSVHALLR